MCVTAFLTETERKRQDRSVQRAEERRCRARMMRVCSPTCPHSNVLAHANAAQGPKRLISKRTQVILASNGMPLGECRLRGPSGSSQDIGSAQRKSQLSSLRLALKISDLSQNVHFFVCILYRREPNCPARISGWPQPYPSP
jgi:hypothetical protein